MKISDSCTGCGLCKFVCKRNAIVIGVNELGETVSTVDENLCVHCGMCKKVCPEITPVKTNKPKECYAAWNNNDKDYKTTTSGGMATLFARKIIEDGGIVYGACMQNDGVVQHIRIEDNEELEKIKGSKYTFSSIVDCYSLIKKDIENEKKVLFIGTPCQVAAMKKMFSTSDLFYAIDLICHGTPPASYFQ